MRSNRISRTAGVLALSGLLVAQLSSAVIIHDTSAGMAAGQENTTSNLSNSTLANDFAVTSANTQPTQLTVWAADTAGGDNGVLDRFSGTLSWGIFDEVAGAPDLFANALATGSDSSPVLVDAGFQNSLNADVVTITIQLTGAPILSAGTYFMGVHEGTWASAYDSTAVAWNGSTTVLGLSQYGTAATGGVWGSHGAIEGGWILEGIVVPEPASFALFAVAGLLCLNRRRGAA